MYVLLVFPVQTSSVFLFAEVGAKPELSPDDLVLLCAFFTTLLTFHHVLLSTVSVIPLVLG